VSKAATKELMPSESKRRTDLEATIEHGLETFIDVGAALLEIRDKRLYRNTHDSFEDYCLKVWDFGSRKAYRLINTAEFTAELPADVPKPKSERSTRPLMELPHKEQRTEAYTNAATKAGKAPTQKQVQEAVDEVKPGDIDIEAPDPDQTTLIITDELGNYVAESLVAVFDSREAFDDIIKRITSLRKDIKALGELPGGAAIRKSVLTDLRNVREAIKFARPYAVATEKAKKTNHIRRPWLTQPEHEALPEELR